MNGLMSKISNKQQTKQQTQKNSKKADPIGENIQTIADLYKHAEHSVSLQQRVIEIVTDYLGQPRFLFIIIIVVTIWIVVNILLPTFGVQNFDPPPFTWLVGLLTLGALLQATLILITQNRQDATTERNRQLDLQLSLLLDEKVSKLITMVDELHQVHPDLKGGADPHVEALKKTVDPHEAVKTLNLLLEE